MEQVIPKCLRFWKLALRGGCLTSFYATLRTRSRGALPLLSADSSPLSEGQGGKPPAPPKSPLFVFRLPSHSFWVVVVPERVPSNKLLSAVLARPTLCIYKGFATFLDVNRPTRRATIWRGARGAGVVLVVLASWCSWCWRGARGAGVVLGL